MAHFPKSINTLNTATQKGKLMKALVEKHGATNVQMVSGRSLRFDLPDGTKDSVGNKVNRVKITARDDGTLDLRLIEITEHDVVGGVAAQNLAQALKTCLNLEV